MGLDMYLNGKRYLSNAFVKGDAERIEAIQKQFPELAAAKDHFGNRAVKEVQIEVGYWRKANAIHDWFVKNVQNGEDKCLPHSVAREQLKQLRAVCQAVLDDCSKAAELLPTRSGFFFGSTDYDEWYFGGVEHTIEVIDNALLLPNCWEFEYRSSW